MKRMLAGLFLCMALIPAPLLLAPSFAFAQNASTTAAATSQNSSRAQNDACVSRILPPWLADPGCFVREFFVIGLGSYAVTISGWTLGTAGLIFNYLIDVTIVRFGQYYDDYLRTSVEQVWAVFRDLANIAIIGSFVFVAISTILGSASYGAKRFLARILIAAILINFSIFFAKLSIDVSHIIAAQFEKGINTNTASNTTLNIASQINTPPGVAGAFLSSMKITSAWNANDTVRTVASRGSGISGALTGFIYILVTSTLFFAAAGVLIFGAALLLIRIVMLTFLLMISALAFGAIAIPGLTSYWDKWFNEFLKNILFGPLLLMFLWATLSVSRKLQEAPGSFQDLITNPGSSVGLIAIVNFLVILGLLYAAIKIPQKMSLATGVKYAEMSRGQWNKILAGAFSSAGINTLGRGASLLYRSKAGEKIAQKADTEGFGGWASRRALRTLQAAQTASFNPALAQKAAADAAKKVTSRLGLNSDGTGGFAAALEKVNKQALEKDKLRNENASTQAKDTEKLDVKKALDEAATNRDLGKKLTEHKAGDIQEAAIIAEEVGKAVKNTGAAGSHEYQRFDEVAGWNKAMNEVRELRATGNQQNAARAQQIEQQVHHAIEQQVQSGRIQRAKHETYEQTLKREFTDKLGQVANKMSESADGFSKFGKALDKAGKTTEAATVFNAAKARSQQTGESLYRTRSQMLAAMRKKRQTEQNKARSESIADAINKKS